MNKHMRFVGLLHRVTVAATGVAILGCSVALGAGLQDSARQARATVDQRRVEAIEKVRQAPQVPNRFVNPQQAPLTILDSSSKEIASAEYYDLVGLTTLSDKLASFPDVKLVNNTGKRATAFSLLLKNEQTKTVHFIKVSGIKVEPFSEYLIASHRWVRLDKQARIVKGEANKNMKIQPTLGVDSEKMWHLGKASDLVVRVGSVEFEDGSKWILEGDADSFS